MPRLDSDIKLDFKDVLVRPKRSTLKSRSEVGERGSRLASTLFLPRFGSSLCCLSVGGPPQRVYIQKLQDDVQWCPHYCLQHGHSRDL